MVAALTTLVATHDAKIDGLTDDVETIDRVREANIARYDKSLADVRNEQRAAMADIRVMLKDALAAVEATCKTNVESVRKEVADLKAQGERAVWSRADKLSALGLAVLIVLTIVGMVLK